jgi:predicted N-acetyltransferase YhbS
MSRIEYRTIRPGERTALLDLLELAFEERELFERYLEHDRRLRDRDTLVALDGERLVGCVQIFTQTIRLRGEAVPLGGVGSVATHPDYERRGIASELLNRAIAEMTRRGMALSLLFTARVSFYERLGWVQVEHPVWVVHRGEEQDRGAELGRRRRASDIPAVRRLYDDYGGDRDTASMRDDAYWSGQLAFAGNPDEDFRVVERAGAVVAYARRIEFMTLARIMEYGRAPGAASELARLLLEMTPAERPLFVPDAGDAELAAALRPAAKAVDTLGFPDQMWRVLDRPRLEALAGCTPEASDADLVRALVAVERAVYWPSDRF